MKSVMIKFDEHKVEKIDKRILDVIKEKTENYLAWAEYTPDEQWYEGAVAEKYNIKNHSDYIHHVKGLLEDLEYNMPNGMVKEGSVSNDEPRKDNNKKSFRGLQKRKVAKRW